MSTIAIVKTLRKSLRFCMPPRPHLLALSVPQSNSSLARKRKREREREAISSLSGHPLFPLNRSVPTNNAHDSKLGITAKNQAHMA
jgi:hypothetical protein